ncbi:hypothetical protein JCM8097_007057 [Rhodosporidiobolus ruineniae]
MTLPASPLSAPARPPSPPPLSLEPPNHLTPSSAAPPLPDSLERATPLDLLLLLTPRPAHHSHAPPVTPSLAHALEEQREERPSQVARADDEAASLSTSTAVVDEAEDDSTPRASFRLDSPPPTLATRPGSRTFISFDRLLLDALDSGSVDGEGEGGREPPSPLGVPGGWTGGRGRKGKGRAEADEEEEEDAALLLPPPFLSDDSAAASFDGLLGARTLRRAHRLQARDDRLRSLGRAPPPPFPQSLFKAAGKVVKLLGPPGGFNARSAARREGEKGVLEEAFEGEDDEAAEERRERRDDETRRRRAKRAESGVRAYEKAAEVGRRVAGRLERHRSRGTVPLLKEGKLRVDVSEEEKEEKENVPPPAAARRMRAATPSQLLGSPPDAFPLLSPLALDVPLSPTLSPLDPVGHPSPLPPAPHLQPNFGAPLPAVQTPFTLDPVEELDEGYFGLKRRTRKTSLASSSSAVADLPNLPFSPHLPPLPSRRSTAYHRTLDLLIYLLIGSPPPLPSTTPNSLDASLSSLGGLVGLIVHLVGFTFFLGYHLAALAVSSYFAARTAGVWAYWAGMNLTGRTEVARAVVGYWRTCRGEWDRVCEEDGERRIGVWAVGRALFELAVLHSMTRARFLSDGPGRLTLLNSPPADPSTPRLGKSSSLRRHKSRPSAALDRPMFTQRQKSYRWTRSSAAGVGGEDEREDGEGLVVSRQDGGVLEGSIIIHDEEVVCGGTRRRPSTASHRAEEEDEDDLPPLDLGHPCQPARSPYLSPSAASPSAPSSHSPPLLPLPEHPAAPLSSFLSTLKRFSRLATASYGLHTYIVDIPTPLLTPSGKTLPHRLFAHLGGIGDHRNVLHVALQKRYEDGGGSTGSSGLLGAAKEKSKEKKGGTDDGQGGAAGGTPYAPQFYLLRDDAHGEIVCVIRGTQTLADVRTDLEGDFVDLPLPAPHPPFAPSSASPADASSPTYRIHSGILAAAQHLLTAPSVPSSSSAESPVPPSSTSPLFSKLRAILAEHPRYALVLTGHSLGAALASTLAVLLAQYDEPSGRWVVDPASELVRPDPVGEDAEEVKKPGEPPFRRPIRAVCFAHPTTVNVPLSLRCALPSSPSSPSTSASVGEQPTPLVVNLSLGADVICRMGVSHVRELRRAVGRLDRLHREEKAAEEEDGEEREEGVLEVWWKWRKVAQAEEDNLEGRQVKRALEEKAWRLRGLVEGFEEEKEDDVDAAVPAGRAYHLDRLPPSVEAQRRAELRSDGEGGGEGEDDEPLLGLYEVGDVKRFYRFPQLEADLVASHMPKAYLDAVDALTL